MKKLVLLYLVYFVLLILSCKRNNQDQEIKVTKNEFSVQNDTDSDSKNGNSALQKITSKEVKTHIGDSLVIRGYVADVYLSEKVAYLNFENKFPKNIFSCAIFSGKFMEFGDLSKFKGRNVEVTGKITTYKNKPQVILNTVDQIKIIQ